MMAALLLLAVQDAPVDCDKAFTQADLNVCAWRSYQEADREMNRQWKITLAKMREWDKGPADGFGPPQAEILLASQRAWLAYRDAQCELEGQYARGGSMQPMLESQCKASMTAARTDALRQAIEEN